MSDNLNLIRTMQAMAEIESIKVSVEGMKASNQERLSTGASPAYVQKDFETSANSIWTISESMIEFTRT